MPRKRKITLEQVDVLGDDRAYFDVWGVFAYEQNTVCTLYITNDYHVASKLHQLAVSLLHKMPVEELKKAVGAIAEQHANEWRGERSCEC